MYREDIKRHEQSYFTLANAGIFLHRLEGSFNPPGQSWTLEVSIMSALTRFQAKAPIEFYLREVYRATGITFLRRTSHKDNQFYVQFFRGDV